MTRNLDRQHDLSGRHLQCLDARLETMQKMLGRSISTNQRNTPKSRTKIAIRTKNTKSMCSNHNFQRAEPSTFSETQSSNQRPATQPFRVVSPALLVYEKDGLLKREVFPLVCSELNVIDDAVKIQMIKHLQGLRLLIWLLKHNNSLTTNVSELGITSHSFFAMQAEWTLLRELTTEYFSRPKNMETYLFRSLPAVWREHSIFNCRRLEYCSKNPALSVKLPERSKNLYRLALFKFSDEDWHFTILILIVHHKTVTCGLMFQSQDTASWYVLRDTRAVLFGLVHAILRTPREPVLGWKRLGRSLDWPKMTM